MLGLVPTSPDHGGHSELAQANHLWAEAYTLWLESLRAESTRRAYRDAWADLLRVLGDVQPWRLGRSDVARWVDDMRRRGLSDCTRSQRLSGISSFYVYCMTEYTTIDAEGREVPLHRYNPAAGRSLRPSINPYGKAVPLTLPQVRALLGVIPTQTLQGLRDFALFTCYLFTGRRNSEVRRLQWGDLEIEGGRVWYRWSNKGKTDQRYEMARPAWLAIRAFLEARGTLAHMAEDDYLFTPLTDRAARLPNVKHFNMNAPLSMREIGRLLKGYARRAKLDAPGIHVHTLRHTAAHLRRLAGDDIGTVSRMLAHSSFAITQIYLSSMEGQADTSWERVNDLLHADDSGK